MLPSFITSSSCPTNSRNLLLVGLTIPLLCNAFSSDVGSATTKILARGPHVGYTRPRPNVEFIVIGTSHFECQSAQEVSSLIEAERPDGVVVELDPERVIRLTKQDAIGEEKDLFGADFLAAIDTAKRLDIPLFLGDEPTQETQQRFVDKMLLPTSYSPKNILEAILRQDSEEKGLAYVDLIQTFANDPRKLLPLAATTLIPFLLLLGSLPNYEFGNGVSNATTALSLIASFFAICKVFNSVIVDRDDLLASRAINAAKVLTSLKQKETLRVRWTFDVDDDYQRPIANQPPPPKLEGVPIFTLKTALETGMTRNLNLFEPRWLKMMDALTHNYSSEDTTTGPVFGCLSCTNKFYSVIQTPDGNEGRYADLIFERKGTLAEIVDDVVEGTRPSGARKVGVKIVGGDAFYIQDDADKLSICEDGYLVATKSILDKRNAHANSEAVEVAQPEPSGGSNESVKVVVVVGLLHANGVISRLSQLA